MRIAIRGGHTKSSYGSVGILDEYIEDRKVYKRVLELLSPYHTMIDVTPDDSKGDGEWNIGVKKANESNIDLFFSIHFNSASGDPQGTEVCVYNTTGTAADYGKKVCSNLSSLGFKNRGLKKRTDLAETANITKPSMIIEVCFVQKSDAELYKKLGVEKISRAIANAIDNKISLAVTQNSNTGSITTSSGVYRVRLSWGNYTSQKGAYNVLDNAINKCKELGSNYKVFDSYGVQVYPECASTYKVKITADVLNVRAGAGTNFKINTTVKKGEVFTIVEEKNNFLKLKSGAGWIHKDYTSKC